MEALGEIRVWAERHVRSELEAHGRVAPSAAIFMGASSEVAYAKAEEPWSSFVVDMFARRTEFHADVLVLFRQRGDVVDVTMLPSDSVAQEFCIPVVVT